MAQIHDRSAPEPSRLATASLRLMVNGYTSRPLAERPQLAPTTIRSHAQSLYRKLGVSDRGVAVAVAMHRDLID